MSSLEDVRNLKFEEYFSSIYGARWPTLFESLKKPVQHILRMNQFADFSGFDKSLSKVDFLPRAFWADSASHIEKDKDGLFLFYKMDPASYFVAKSLDVQLDEEILDLCAAPGGKSLILAEGLNETGRLISNEISQGRRERLTRVFQEYIPKEKRTNIFVKGADGNQYGMKNIESFHRVLADVPCSGERHLLENKTEYLQWTIRRSQNLAVRQFSLLSSAWLATQIGGRIVYSTCSISPIENDQVIEKLIKRRKVEVRFEPTYEMYDFLEKTKHGYQVLPDKCGFGPMYFSILNKA